MIPDDVILRPWKLPARTDAVWKYGSITGRETEVVAAGYYGAPAGCPSGFIREPVPLELWPADAAADKEAAPVFDPIDFGFPRASANVLWARLNQPSRGDHYTYLSTAIHAVPRLRKLFTDSLGGAPRPFNCIPPGDMGDFFHISADHVALFSEVADLLHSAIPGKVVREEATTGAYVHLLRTVLHKTRGMTVPVLNVSMDFTWGEIMHHNMEAAEHALDLENFSEHAMFHPVKWSMVTEGSGLKKMTDRFDAEQWASHVVRQRALKRQAEG
jgi:hypothetical protein